MRRFDHEYAQLKALIDGGELGQPLVLHCAHRNPAVPPTFDSAMVVQRLAGARGRRHPLSLRRGDRLDPDHQAGTESRCASGPCRSADRDHADRVRQTRRRRTVRHHRSRLRGAHRAGRRVGQRDDRTGRRPGPQGRTGDLGRPASRPASGSGSVRLTTPSSSAGSTRCWPVGPPAITQTGRTRGTATPRPRSARPASSRCTADGPSRSRSSIRLRSRGCSDEDRARSHTVSPRLRAARIPAPGRGTGLRAPAADPAPRLHPVLQPPARRRRPRGAVPQGVRGRGRRDRVGAARCCGGPDPTRTPAKPRCATGSASCRSPSTSGST